MGLASQIIYRMLNKKRMTQKELAAAVGEDPRHTNQQLCRVSDIKLERFILYADAAGYDVVVIDRISGTSKKLECSKKICKNNDFPLVK